MIDTGGDNSGKRLPPKAATIRVFQLMRVVDITKNGRPVIRFIDDDTDDTDDDGGAKGGDISASKGSKPEVATSKLSSLRESEKKPLPLTTTTTAATATATATTALAGAGAVAAQTGTAYDVDSAQTIERICLEHNGQDPKTNRKNASESWKHVHVFRPTEGHDDHQEREEIYVGSLFAMRMDTFNHLRNENAKKRVMLEDAAALAEHG